MLSEELELLISRFVDGDLSPAEQAQLDAEIVRNPEALKALEHHLKVDVALKAEPAMPPINWERLATHISMAVDNEGKEREEKKEEKPKEKTDAKPAWQAEKKPEKQHVPLRVAAPAPEPSSYSIAWRQISVGILALAASLLLVVGIWSMWNRSDNSGIARNNSQPSPAPAFAGKSGEVYVFVTGEKPTGPGVAQITIAPPPALSGKDLAVREAIVPRLTRVAIDSGVIPAQDSDSMLFR